MGLSCGRRGEIERVIFEAHLYEDRLGPAIVSLDPSIQEAEGASRRVKALLLKRKQAYASLFDGFASEQAQLEAMYRLSRACSAPRRGRWAS